jgi:8-oxo-dGTP pyrophosphatase MutT (NUDIX family)
MRVVVAGLIWRLRDDRSTPEVLVMKRPPDAPFYPNVWVAPGGGVELGDLKDPADEFGVRALHRELAEELGPEIEVEIRRYDLRGHRAFVRGDGTGVVVLTYVCRWRKGEPVVTAEAVEFAWVSQAEVGDYDLIGDTADEVVDACRYVEPF